MTDSVLRCLSCRPRFSYVETMISANSKPLRLSAFVIVQAQHSHHVIQQVLNHLDTHNRNTPRVRAGIVQVLLETVAIAAKGSVGELQHRAGSHSWTSHT